MTTYYTALYSLDRENTFTALTKEWFYGTTSLYSVAERIQMLKYIYQHFNVGDTFRARDLANNRFTGLQVSWLAYGEDRVVEYCPPIGVDHIEKIIYIDSNKHEHESERKVYRVLWSKEEFKDYFEFLNKFFTENLLFPLY